MHMKIARLMMILRIVIMEGEKYHSDDEQTDEKVGLNSCTPG